jgi:hypothetical protein
LITYSCSGRSGEDRHAAAGAGPMVPGRICPAASP